VSLLTGNLEVTLTPETESTDEYGNVGRSASGTPVPVTCRVQPLTAAESVAIGQQVNTVYRLIAREWPAGAFAGVTWDGRDWDILGEPKRSRGGPATQHVTVLIRARKPEAVSGG
jgi:hypothetical protein